MTAESIVIILKVTFQACIPSDGCQIEFSDSQVPLQKEIELFELAPIYGNRSNEPLLLHLRGANRGKIILRTQTTKEVSAAYLKSKTTQNIQSKYFGDKISEVKRAVSRLKFSPRDSIFVHNITMNL